MPVCSDRGIVDVRVRFYAFVVADEDACAPCDVASGKRGLGVRCATACPLGEFAIPTGAGTWFNAGGLVNVGTAGAVSYARQCGVSRIRRHVSLV